MVRISILGSCVTRDAFEKSEALSRAIVYYAARTSFISVVGEPISVNVPETEGISAFELRCLRGDLEKTFFDGLIKSKPDILFIDLIDERYPICRMSNSWFSYNPVIQAIESLSALEACTRMEKSSTDALHAWNAAVDKWAATIRLVLPGLRIVLVDARFAIVSRSSSGNEIAEDGAMLNWCQESNRMLEKMMAKLISALPGAHVIAPPKEVCVSDGDHRWGKQPFHYVTEWYDYVAKSALQEVDDSELRE